MTDDALYLTPHESVRIREHSSDVLEVEARWDPNGSAPPKHFHPGQDEEFEVLEGVIRARVDGAEHTLRQGDTLEVPRGAVHQMWNAGHEPARAIWRTAPAGRTARWFAELDGLRRSGRVGRNGMPGPLALGAYLTEYRDVIRLAGPQPILRPVLAALGALGRLRGYRPAEPEQQRPDQRLND
jgi:mannose-6-phosphate isomerase-like protein (cupin superfamily)